MGETDVPLKRLILRCIVRPDREVAGRWVASCIDLDLWAVGKDPVEAQRSLHDAIHGYIETVLEEPASVAALLHRWAPLRHRARWHALRLLSLIHQRGSGPPTAGQSYEDFLPFQLAVAV